ncbi:hypothetical protein BGX28_002299, partial [Mortierella sp. GBA30]
MSDFEKAHGLPRQYVTRQILYKKSKLERMPIESAGTRYNVRDDVQPFYPIEVVLKHAINVVRDQYLLPVDHALAQIMAHDIYSLLTARVGALSFERPRFTNGWMANFKEVWGYRYHEMKGEAASVDMDKIAAEIEEIKPILQG